MNQESNTDKTLNLANSTEAALKILQSEEPNAQSQIDELWMTQAIDLAKKAWQENEVPVGAILVNELQEVVGTGYNQLIGQHDPSAHAEIQAIRAAGQSQQNYRHLNTTLYVTLEPCAMCAGAIVHARIKRLVFGAKDEKTGAAGSYMNYFTQEGLNHYSEITGGVLAEQTGQLLSDFFAMRREQKKMEKIKLRNHV